jgi:hypothetical protein
MPSAATGAVMGGKSFVVHAKFGLSGASKFWYPLRRASRRYVGHPASEEADARFAISP